MGYNTQNILKLKPAVADSLISAPKAPNILFRHNSPSNTLLPQQRLIQVEPDTVRAEKVERTETNTIQAISWKKVPFSLSHSDSIKFNLANKSERKIDWEMKFDLQTQFNDSAYTTIAPFYLQSDSTENIIEVTEKPTIKKQKLTSTETSTKSIQNTGSQSDKSVLYNQDWMFGFLLLSVFMVGIIRMKHYKYLRNLFVSLLYPTLKDDGLSTTNISNRSPSYLLGFLFYFNSALFVYQLSELTENPLFGLSGLIIIPLSFLFLFAIFSLKIIVFRIAGAVFGTTPAVNKYLAQSAHTSKVFALLILPFIVFIPFATEPAITVLYKMVFVLFASLYLLQIGRGIKNNLTSIFSVYYLILYLCALEIVPLTLLFKVLFK